MKFELRRLAEASDGTATYAACYCEGCGARMLERANHDVHENGRQKDGDDLGWIATCNAVLICPNNCRTCGRCLRLVAAGKNCTCKGQ